jgi:hypothetical protein
MNMMRPQQRAVVPRERIIDDFFAYTTGVLVLAATVGATVSNNISIQADSDFLWEKLTFFADVGATTTESTRVIPSVTLMITDTGSGRQMFNVPVSLNAIAGPGGLPYILSRPKLFDSNSVIQITLVNRLATAYNIEILMSGRKRFNLG